MKKLMIVAQILALTLIFAAPAMAGAKISKELCMSLNTGGPPLLTMQLAIKKGGKIKYSNIKSTFYNIQGTIAPINPTLPSYPCSGSGYINETFFPIPAFAASIQCSTASGPIFVDLAWSLENTEARGVYMTPMSGVTQGFTAVEADCKSAIQY